MSNKKVLSPIVSYFKILHCIFNLLFFFFILLQVRKQKSIEASTGDSPDTYATWPQRFAGESGSLGSQGEPDDVEGGGGHPRTLQELHKAGQSTAHVPRVLHCRYIPLKHF
jgi:hypothetical protein